LEARRRLAVVGRRYVEEYGRTVGRVHTDRLAIFRSLTPAVGVREPGGLRGIEPGRIRGRIGIARPLLQQRQIVEDPEGAAMCCRHHFALPRIDRDVAYLRVRQTHAERLPLRAPIEAGVDAVRVAEEHERSIVRILLYDEYGLIVRQPVRQNSPVLAEIR